MWWLNLEWFIFKPTRFMKIHEGGFFFLLNRSVHTKAENFEASKWDPNALPHILSRAVCGEDCDRPFWLNDLCADADLLSP